MFLFCQSPSPMTTPIQWNKAKFSGQIGFYVHFESTGRVDSSETGAPQEGDPFPSLEGNLYF